MTSLLALVLGGVLVALLPGWTAPAHATGERLVDDYRSVYGTPGVAAAVIDGPSVERIVRGRDGDGNAVTARTRPTGGISESYGLTICKPLVREDSLLGALEADRATGRHPRHYGELGKTYVRKDKGWATDVSDCPPKKIVFHTRTPQWCRDRVDQTGPATTEVIAKPLDGPVPHWLRSA
ncbi:hypothetical protein [Streptosporangium sp. NPDC006007]|uniref:hypothetical protein n=1 Tax=Streptosporangium sp. NPDC006007 TaxID=3154575 RepID=UPI0033A91AA5